MGDLITLKTLGLKFVPNDQTKTFDGQLTPEYVHFTLQYTGLLTIGDSGVNIYD